MVSPIDRLIRLWLRFTKCNNSTLGMVEFVSPFDTIFVANTHERFEEGRSKVISSANDVGGGGGGVFATNL